MLLNITNGEVSCPFDDEDIVDVSDLSLVYHDEFNTHYDVPLESKIFLQQGGLKRRTQREVFKHGSTEGDSDHRSHRLR
jgi:hypothetical protein